MQRDSIKGVVVMPEQLSAPVSIMTGAKAELGEVSAGIAALGEARQQKLDRCHLFTSCYVPCSTRGAPYDLLCYSLHSARDESRPERPSRCPRLQRTHLSRNSDRRLFDHNPRSCCHMVPIAMLLEASSFVPHGGRRQE